MKIIYFFHFFCIELEGKSLEEVKNLVYELELQANIYSELLCNELDYRDKLKRDIEGQNNFISTYVAVERKLNNSIQDKKKKNRYGFFKANDDDHNKVSWVLVTLRILSVFSERIFLYVL